MNRPPQNLQKIGVRIGLFFLEQNGNDYKKTADFMQRLNITDIKESPDKITIHTARPGLLIGRKGCNIEGLQKRFTKKIHIVESFSWVDVITPADYDAIEDY